jgi:hypothetical protein
MMHGLTNLKKQYEYSLMVFVPQKTENNVKCRVGRK